MTGAERRGPGRLPRWTRAGAAATAPVVLAVLALVHPGQAVSQLDLHDGGVWLTNASTLQVGRFSSTVDELNGGLVATSERLDVLQDGGDVLLVEPGTVSVVDPASVATTTSTTVPDGARVGMAGGTVAVVDPVDGALWTGTVDDLGALRTDGEPVADLGPGGAAVVARSGDVLAVAADGTRTTVDARDGGVRVDARPPAAGAAAGAAEAVTAVGDHLVTLTGSTLGTPSHDVDLSAHGTPLTLQQPGPDAESVLVAGPSALLEVPLDGGPVRELRTGGSGRPAAPVRLGACVHAAWASSSGSYLSRCAGEGPRTVDLEGMTGADVLVFRVNRSVVVLNDTARGRVWVPTRDAELREPRWEAVEPEPEQLEGEPDADTATSDRTPLADCTARSAPPAAGDDDFGVRPGRTTVLPVLDNDSASDCGTLVISDVDPIPATFGTLALVHGDRALQLTPAEGASGASARGLTFTYTVTDGRGSSAPSTATVRVTLRPDGTNGPPTQVRRPTTVVEPGATASLDVLPTFTDPDGDDLVLVGAGPADPSAGTPDGGATVRTSPDGTVTVTASGAALGPTQVRLLVSDGIETVEGVLLVDVRPAGSVVPVVEPVHAVTTVDVPVTIRPLDFVRGGTLEPARLAGVDPVDGLTVVPDLADGTFTVSAPRAGTYYVTFLVSAPPQQAGGVARIDVRERPTDPGAPVAVADRALLPPAAEVTVDPLANDVDPAGGVLVLQSAWAPDGTGLEVVVLGHGLLRIRATRVLDGPVVVPYVVSNGTASARGEVLVRPVPASATPSAPVVPDVEVSVRAGGVVTVPVLEGAHDPDGQPLTLDRDLVEPLPEGEGLLFVSGDVLRYRAPDRPLTTRARFAVRDADSNAVTATLTVAVHAADPDTKAPPRPEPVTARAFAGETTRIAIPLVGIDPDGDGVTLLGLDRAPTKGRIVEVGADWLEYEALGEVGTDEFSYAVEDWVGQRAVATVRVGIAERPSEASPVVAREDDVTVRPGRTVEVRVLANDVDPAGEELRLDPGLVVGDGLDAHVEGRRVVVRAPETEGTWHVEYRASTSLGRYGTAVLTVHVDADAPAVPPVARDVVVPADRTVGRTEVEVDVLAVAENRMGPLSDLTVAVDPSAAAVARVTAAGAVVVTLGPSAQTLPYVLTHVGTGLASYAFVTVPARGDFPPMLRPRAPKLVVLAGQELLIPLAEQVQVGPGRTARIVDVASVQATKADGSPLVRTTTTLAYRAPRTYAGPASISFEVTDAAGTETVGRTRVLTLPITVHAIEERPPVFRSGTVDVAPGEAPVTVDLTALTVIPPGHPAADAPRYTLDAAGAPGLSATLSGSQLRVQAPTAAPRGTGGSLRVTVALGDGAPVEGRLELRVTASTRPLARPADVAVTDGVEDRTRTVDVLDGAFNPFPGERLTLVDATVETPGAGTASVSGDAVAVRPAPGFIGTVVTRYSVRDATGDPAREVEGRVAVTVRGRPGTPTAPRVVEVGDRTAVLAWDAPIANGEPITAYRVTGAPGGVVRECAGTTCTVDGLTNDTAYTFTVAARNAVDWSAESPSSATVRPDAQPAAPAAPSVTAGDRQLTASWPVPVSPGSPVERYTVEVSPVPPAGAAITTTGTSVTVKNLTNGAEYVVRVRAHNRTPEPGAWSAWSTGAVPAGVPGTPAPGAVRHDTGGSTAAGRLDVVWAAPTANGADVTGYEVAVDGASVATLPASATTWTFDGAERGRTYTIAVRARNAVGWSGWGSTPGETWSAPSEPRDATAADGGGSDVPWGEGSVVLAWQAPADTGGAGITVSGYEVEGHGRTTAASMTVTGLTAGTSPTFRVRAWSSREEPSAWVTIPPTTVTTAPSAPGGVTATPTGGDRLRVEWTAPGSTGGDPLTGYRVRVDGGAWTEVGPGATGADVTRSSAGASAVVDVQAGNARGWSPAARTTVPPDDAPAGTEQEARTDAGPVDGTVDEAARTAGGTP